MRLLKISCVGTFPLMMDRMSSDVLDSLATKIKVVTANDEPDDVVAKRKIYTNDAGQIAIPSTMLLAALTEAGREVAYQGKIKISTADKSKLPALVQIREEYMPLFMPGTTEEAKWVVDKRRGVLEATGSAVCLRRPKFPVWEFGFTMQYDNDLIKEETVRSLLDNAGKFQGLGSYRPSCRGPFGVFGIQKLEDITPDEWVQRDKKNRKPAAAETSDSDTSQEPAGISTNGDSKSRTSRKTGLVPITA